MPEHLCQKNVLNFLTRYAVASCSGICYYNYQYDDFWKKQHDSVPDRLSSFPEENSDGSGCAVRFDMMEWLTGTTAGKFIWAFLISMVPVIELRGGLPVAITSGLPWPLAYLATVLGNMLPVPFIIIFIKKIFAWLRKHWPGMDRVVTRLEKRAESKSDTVERYGPWGLLLFVAIPAPGTGAWTGALIAALMNMKLKQAVPVILIGVCIAGLIVTGVTYGAIHVF